MTIPKKRHRITGLKLREISSVDYPAQVGAVSVLIKRLGDEDMTYETILKSAADVAKGAKPTLARLQYENAMLERAERIAAITGVSPEKALSQSLTTDSVLRELAIAYEVANGAEYAVEVNKRYAVAAAA